MLHEMFASIWEEIWLLYQMNKCKVCIWVLLKEKKFQSFTKEPLQYRIWNYLMKIAY